MDASHLACRYVGFAGIGPTVIDMDAAPPDVAETGSHRLSTAPDHITEILAGLIRQTPCRLRPQAPCHSDPENCRTAERRQAQQIADQIWAEAAHAGAVWAMSRQPASIKLDLDGDDPRVREFIADLSTRETRPR